MGPMGQEAVCGLKKQQELRPVGCESLLNCSGVWVFSISVNCRDPKQVPLKVPELLKMRIILDLGQVCHTVE